MRSFLLGRDLQLATVTSSGEDFLLRGGTTWIKSHFPLSSDKETLIVRRLRNISKSEALDLKNSPKGSSLLTYLSMLDSGN